LQCFQKDETFKGFGPRTSSAVSNRCAGRSFEHLHLGSILGVHRGDVHLVLGRIGGRGDLPLLSNTILHLSKSSLGSDILCRESLVFAITSFTTFHLLRLGSDGRNWHQQHFRFGIIWIGGP
jgi:hypothetical protein